MIEVINRQRLIRVDAGRIESLGRAVLAAGAKGAAGTATIAIVRDRSIRELNRRYRGLNSATDVLSFPSKGPTQENASPPAIANGETDGYLGDVVISAETALRQAAEAGHTVEREIDELVIHGLLHLRGYDHETDRGEMNKLEVRLRRTLLER